MTPKQIQCLLLYLGYDVAVDGISGPQTKQAQRCFCNEFGSGDLLQAVKADWKRPASDFWQEIQYFKRNDPFIGCSCGSCGGFPVEPEKILLVLADRVRGHFGAPLIPTSTVRCKAHNAAVGGVKNSRHLLGKAMDFRVKNVPAETVLAYVKKQPEIRYAYQVNHRVVHMDIP